MLSTFPPPRLASFCSKFHQGLLRREEDETTVQRRDGKPDGDNASLVTARFIRTDTQRIIIECPESDSPLRGRIHLRRLLFRQPFKTSCSPAADHTLSPIHYPNNLKSRLSRRPPLEFRWGLYGFKLQLGEICNSSRVLQGNEDAFFTRYPIKASIHREQ